MNSGPVSISMVRHLYGQMDHLDGPGPTARWSDTSLVRRLVGPTDNHNGPIFLWSDGSPRWSDTPMLRQPIAFQKIVSRKNIICKCWVTNFVEMNKIHLKKLRRPWQKMNSGMNLYRNLWHAKKLRKLCPPRRQSQNMMEKGIRLLENIHALRRSYTAKRPTTEMVNTILSDR